MILQPLLRKRIFLLLEIAFLIASAYHAVGIFYLINNAPYWKHALFTGLDLLCLYGFIKRPPFFLFFFGAFTLQQYYSHGRQLVEWWISRNEIHWTSILVLVLLPAGLICLVKDALESTIQGILTNSEAQ